MVCHRGYYIELCLGRVFPQSLHRCQQMALVFLTEENCLCVVLDLDGGCAATYGRTTLDRTTNVIQYCHAPTTAATTTDKNDALRPAAEEVDAVAEAVAAALVEVPPAAAGVVDVTAAPAPAAPGPPPAPG